MPSSSAGACLQVQDAAAERQRLAETFKPADDHARTVGVVTELQPPPHDDVGHGVPIVWSHGFMMDRTMFADVVDRLPEMRHITWDQRGFGEHAIVGPFTFWDSADDVVRLLDRLGIERAILAGWSQGGFVSLRATLAAPDRVGGLLLISTSAAEQSAESAAVYRAMVERWLLDDGVADLAPVIADIIIGSKAAAAHWIPRWLEARPGMVAAVADCLLDRDSIESSLEAIDIPAVVLHGTEDAAIPLHEGRDLAAALPNAELIEVAGSPHGLPFTAPARIADAARALQASIAQQPKRDRTHSL